MSIMSGTRPHQSVLLAECLTGLAIKPEGCYVDATFGRGGHSEAILKALGPEGKLFAFDQDQAAIEAASAPPFLDPRFTIFHAPFSQLQDMISAAGYLGRVDGILVDLGVSSPQLDEAMRGFSFMHSGPLDMRMNQSTGFTAADFINHASETEIANVLWELGEERFSRRIAKAIVQSRSHAPITTTGELSEIIKTAHPAWERRIHPATRSFQALRLHVNHELDELRALLNQVAAVLAPGGRLCIISFHSLEDRLVKQFIQKASGYVEDDLRLPIPLNTKPADFKKRGGLIRPSEKEIADNPRARSARLRIAERLG
jgi:16S rRNA (cytosine1402-N4)-methyltransferase